MGNVLFTNVRIIDGSGAEPYSRRRAGAGQSHRARDGAAALAAATAAP
jgi:hypothetical protein